jgi:hypothetical protein
MNLYLAGPLFTPAEREYLDRLAARLDSAGHRCFVPHRQVLETPDPTSVFAVDSAGLRDAEAVVAWLDGPTIDDGTACEIGIFSELVRTNPSHHRGIIGLSTDLRLSRRREAGIQHGGHNLFVAGTILEYGRLAWSVDETVSILGDWGRN